MNLYTSDEYGLANPDWHEADSRWKAGHIRRLLERNDVRPESIVDVGCGVGAVLQALAPSVPARMTGYDIAPIALERAFAKGTDRLQFKQGDPFQSGETYDLAMAIDVFEHVEDCFGFLRAMRRLGRRQLYHIPLDLSAQAVARRSALLATRKRIGHLHYFTKETALATLEDTGHHVVDWVYTAGAVEAPDGSLRKRIAALPRRIGFGLAPDLTVRLLGGFSMMVLCD